MIKIKRWDNGKVIHSGDFTSVKKCLEDGVKKGVSFYRADLQGADLRWANLRGADLGWAYLEGANLRGADLEGAYLWGCIGNDKQIKNIPGGILEDFPYKITYTKDYLQIGCQGMSVQGWLSLSDEDLEYLDGREGILDLKNKYQDIILNYIKDNPAGE